MTPTEMINEHAKDEARLQYLRDEMLRQLYAHVAASEHQARILLEFDELRARVNL